jgi:transglutaminase-like putative cysteine protease
MKALRDLVLLGVLCQALAADSWLQAALFVPLGWAAARWRRPRPLLGQHIEAALFLLGLVSAYRYSRAEDFPLFVSLGYPLLGLQLVRLAGPLDERTRLFTLGIAVMHLTVGSLAVFDWKFVPLMLGALGLVPRALAGLEAERYGSGAVRPAGPWARRLFLLGGLMAVFFVMLPRSSARRALPLGLVPAVLDTTRGGSEAAERPLFRVEGEELRYLRVITLDTFDGTIWTASPESARRQRSFGLHDPERHLRRVVGLLAPDWTGPVCPIDGHVVALDATFLSKPGLAVSGGVIARRTRLREENECVYWIERGEVPEPLPPQVRSRVTALPPQPERLRRWLDQVLGPERAPAAQAERLATHLRESFTYSVGAPALSRLAPIADFVFNQRSGHCERFASALAVLLRMKGVPSRVALGYLPLERNRSGSTTTVTAKQGHAWTEAWFEGRGWVAFDATPYAGSLQGLPVPFLERAQEWIRDFWYQKVVFFSGSERSELLQNALGALRLPIALLGAHFLDALALAAAVVGLLALWRWSRGLQASRARPDPAERARHFYGQMLRLLARRGHRRRPTQTPIEFLRDLEQKDHPYLDEIRLITGEFCASRYGEAELTPEALERLERSLRCLAGQSARRGAWPRS